MERVPILKMGDFLLVSIQVDMHDGMAAALQEDLTRKIIQTGTQGILIDVSAMNIVDAFLGRFLGKLVSTARIMDAEAVIVGMQPAVALTLVEMGITLPDLSTALNIDLGIELLRKRPGIVGRDEGNEETEERNIDHIEGHGSGESEA